MAENKNIISQHTIFKVRSTIKNKFPKLNNTDTLILTNEAIEVYKKYYTQNSNIKIKISNFLIFYIVKKLEDNLSKQDLMLVLKENENVFATGKGVQSLSLRAMEKEANKQNLQYFNSIKEKISSCITISDYSFRKKITTLSNNYPELSFENIATLIIDAINQKINKFDIEYTVIEYCKKFKIDFFMVLDIYIGILLTKPIENKPFVLLNSINEASAINSTNIKVKSVSYFDLSEELAVNPDTLEKQVFRLQNRFTFVPKNIILNSVCDYYYIKYHDNKLLELISKTRSSYRNKLLLEIVLLRMEQILTYEEAYEIAVKNFENGTSLLYSKYGDSYEGKKQDIYSKK